jgi:hypothetical protein
MDGTEHILAIHNGMRVLLSAQKFNEACNTMKFLLDSGADSNELKTLLVITKSFKNHPDLCDIRKEVLDSLEKKLGHKIA